MAEGTGCSREKGSKSIDAGGEPEVAGRRGGRRGRGRRGWEQNAGSGSWGRRRGRSRFRHGRVHGGSHVQPGRAAAGRHRRVAGIPGTGVVVAGVGGLGLAAGAAGRGLGGGIGHAAAADRGRGRAVSTGAPRIRGHCAAHHPSHEKEPQQGPLCIHITYSTTGPGKGIPRPESVGGSRFQNRPERVP